MEFAAIGPAAYDAAAMALVGTMAGAGQPGDSLGADVLSAVSADLVAARARSQYRIRFTIGSDEDGLADVVICDGSSLGLTLTYRTP